MLTAVSLLFSLMYVCTHPVVKDMVQVTMQDVHSISVIPDVQFLLLMCLTLVITGAGLM